MSEPCPRVYVHIAAIEYDGCGTARVILSDGTEMHVNESQVNSKQAVEIFAWNVNKRNIQDGSAVARGFMN